MHWSRIVYLRAARRIYNPSAGTFIIYYTFIMPWPAAVLRATWWFRLESPATCRVFFLPSVMIYYRRRILEYHVYDVLCSMYK